MAHPGDKVDYDELNLLFSIANSKPRIGGRPYDIADSWADEMVRLRSNLIALMPTSYLEIVKGGPWPFNYGTTVSANVEVWFYFADTSSSHHVTLSQNGPVQSVDPAHYDMPTAAGTVTGLTCKIKIGGKQTCHFKGRFLFELDTASGSPNASATSTFPGVSSWSHLLPGSYIGQSSFITNYIDTDIDPGEYEFTITCGGSTTMHYPFLQECLTQTGDPGGAGLTPILTTTAGTVEACNGIHSAKDVYRIKCLEPPPNAIPPDPVAELGFGLYMLVYNSLGGFFYWHGRGSTFTADLAGLWVKKTGPIASLPNPTGYMPWNPLTSLGVPTGGNISEEVNNPFFTTATTWAASTAKTPGRWINGPDFWFLCIQGGTTGSTAPTWPTRAGAVVLDGSVKWKAYSYFGVPSRVVSMPRYPFRKDGSPHPKDPENLPHWSNFKNGWLSTISPIYQRFWWIRRVRLNRIRPSGADNATLYGGAEIPVTLGCIRSGSFVAFGTWDTGSWVEVETGFLDEDDDPIMTQHLLWPIFTKDALVYQASERVDVQAEIIDGAPSFGSGITPPILADHINDTWGMLNLIT